MDSSTGRSAELWHPEDEFSSERLRDYFCERIRPKLSELEDIRELNDLENAIIELLKWRDDGTVKVSKQFREFYDGLLFFSSVQRLRRPRPLQELIGIFFEIHGSDPRTFPEAMKIGLHLFNQALTKVSLHSQENGLLDVLSEASSLGSQAANMLQILLENYRRRLPADALGNPYEKLVRREKWLQLPFGHGLTMYALLAQESILEDIQAWLTPAESHQRQAQKETLPTLEASIGAAPNAIDRGINVELLPPDLEIDGYSQIFVGPSGCGKTSKIKSLLKQHWGLYLLPGNLPEESNESELKNRLEYKPRRGDGSRDTQTWFEQAKSLQELGLLSLPNALMDAYKVLTARLSILEQFRALDPHRTASDWLKLQTNCREPRNDLFNHLYRVARLTEGISLRPRTALNSKLIFCFDEAQCDLPEMPPGEMKWSSYSEKVRPIACMYLAAFQTNSDHNGPKNLKLFLSGTALQLRHLQKVIKSYAAVITQMADKHFKTSISIAESDLAPKVNRDFRLVNGKNFRTLINAIGYHYDKKLLEIVIKNSESLHGRVVWSVCYLDEIQKLVDSHRGDQKRVLDNQVKEISMRVGKMAKKGLKDRLEDMRRTRAAMDGSALLELQLTELENRSLQLPVLKNQLVQIRGLQNQLVGLDNQLLGLQKTGLRNLEESTSKGILPELHSIKSALKSFKNEPDKVESLRAPNQRHQHEELIEELCSLAIRSDLLGEATIFKSRESEDLVASGFAFLDETQDSSRSRVKLKERLVVDAAIEYFQCQKLSNGQSEYDRALINFLYSEQSNASALGKIAELFFAWSLRKTLGTRTNVILPAVGDRYRTHFLQLLVGNAHTVEHLESRDGSFDARNQFSQHATPDTMTALQLVEGMRTAYQEEVDEERTITMWNWLRKIRNGIEGDDLQSTCWFPSNNTGPDVLFAMKKKIPETPKDKKPQSLPRKKTPEATTSLPHRHHTQQHTGKKRKRDSEDLGPLNYSLVLCAVQIKRQERINDPAKAIATTDPNRWFCKNNARDAQKIAEELGEWQDARYPIVRILVSALTDPIPYRGPKNAATEIRITSDQQYYTSIGKGDDNLLFGDAFRRLREAQGI